MSLKRCNSMSKQITRAHDCLSVPPCETDNSHATRQLFFINRKKEKARGRFHVLMGAGITNVSVID